MNVEAIVAALESLSPQVRAAFCTIVVECSSSAASRSHASSPSWGKLSASDLAAKYAVPRASLAKSLERWRWSHDDGYDEVSNRRRNESKFLYDEAAVLPVVEALRARVARRSTVHRDPVDNAA